MGLPANLTGHANNADRFNCAVELLYLPALFFSRALLAKVVLKLEACALCNMILLYATSLNMSNES